MNDYVLLEMRMAELMAQQEASALMCQLPSEYVVNCKLKLNS
jgi:hypothetical protein